MKKFILFLFMQMAVWNGFAQTNQTPPINRDSILAVIPALLENIDSRMMEPARYKLYPTNNIYTFLKLNTETGCIWQLQWSLDRKEEFSVIINGVDWSVGTGRGTFELYPTQNMYQFILLDKVYGRTWHVQWGMDDAERWIRPIY